MKKCISLLALLICLGASAHAQDSATNTSAPVPTDPFEAQYIPRNSKVYIAPIKSEDNEKPVTGFESYLAAAFRKKSVPLILVAERTQADFEITGSADKKGAGWAKKVFLGDFRGTSSASMQVVNLHTGVVAYADASHRASANKGLRSSAEKLAKYLKRKIDDDEKKLSHHAKKA
ncbi:MAG: hypothetical protein ACJ74W_10300 [Pyrinomonadaceae bacterium]